MNEVRRNSNCGRRCKAPCRVRPGRGKAKMGKAQNEEPSQSELTHRIRIRTRPEEPGDTRERKGEPPDRTATFPSPGDLQAPATAPMASAKLLYIVVVDDSASSFRYTRSLLHSTLQLMGCKPRHAFEVRPSASSSSMPISPIFHVLLSDWIGSSVRSLSLVDQPQGVRCHPG